MKLKWIYLSLLFSLTLSCKKLKEATGVADSQTAQGADQGPVAPSGGFEIRSVKHYPEVERIHLDITPSAGALGYRFFLSANQSCEESFAKSYVNYLMSDQDVIKLEDGSLRLTYPASFQEPGDYFACIQAFSAIERGAMDSCSTRPSYYSNHPGTKASNNGVPLEWKRNVISIADKAIQFTAFESEGDYYRPRDLQKHGNFLSDLKGRFLYSMTSDQTINLGPGPALDSVYVSLTFPTELEGQIDVAVLNENLLLLNTYDEALQATEVIRLEYPEGQGIVALGKDLGVYWLLEFNGSALSYRTFSNGAFSVTTAIQNNEIEGLTLISEGKNSLKPLYFIEGQPYLFESLSYIQLIPGVAALSELKREHFDLMPQTAFPDKDLVYRHYEEVEGDSFRSQSPLAYCSYATPMNITYRTMEFPGEEVIFPDLHPDSLKVRSVGKSYIKILDEEPLAREIYLQVEASELYPQSTAVLGTSLRVIWSGPKAYLIDLNDYLPESP